ncbi:hypothetical protein Tco_1162444 [Tanacetum coccineum]
MGRLTRGRGIKRTGKVHVKAGSFEIQLRFGGRMGKVMKSSGRISRNSIDRQRCGCQDKKRMKKQHGVHIKAVEVQIGWLWTWPGKRSDDFGCDRGGGRCPGKVENRDGSKEIKAAVTQGRE